MKHLILIRHAECAEKVTGQTDKDRELTTSGMRQSATVGQFLKKHPTPIDIIISSAATRASTTAQLISEQIDRDSDIVVVNDSLYEASLGTLFDMLRNGDQYHNVAVVAHNPTISYFAEFITGTALDDMKPATVFILKLDIGNWKDMTKGSATLRERCAA